MTLVKLISETYLKEIAPINLNVDMKDLVVHIVPAQDLHIQPILGTNLYNEILEAYSGQTLSANQIKLVEYIKPAVAFKTIELALPFLTFNIKNKGLQLQFGDNSKEVELEVVNYMRNEVKNLAEFYSERIVQFLYINSNLFPSYIAPNTDIAPDKSSQFDSGFVFYKNNSCTNSFN